MALAFAADWISEAKTWLREHEHGDTLNERLLQLLAGIVDDVETRRWHTFIERKTRTVYPAFVYGDRTLSLRGWPVKRVDSLTYDADRVFIGVDAVDQSLYFVDSEAAQIVFDEPLLARKQGTVQVVYSGGLATDFASLKAAYPGLVQGVCMWAGDWVDRGSRMTARERTSGQGLGVVQLDAKIPPAALELIGVRPRLRAG